MSSAGGPPDFPRLELLVFSMGETRFGCDLDQTEGLLTPREAAERDIEVRPFHQTVSFGVLAEEYRMPGVLLLKGSEGRRGILIERPEDIVTLSVGEIRPLPPLMRRDALRGGIWGIGLTVRGMIVLVDLRKLYAAAPSPANKRSGFGRPGGNAPEHPQSTGERYEI